MALSVPLFPAIVVATFIGHSSVEDEIPNQGEISHKWHAVLHVGQPMWQTALWEEATTRTSVLNHYDYKDHDPCPDSIIVPAFLLLGVCVSLSHTHARTHACTYVQYIHTHTPSVWINLEEAELKTGASFFCKDSRVRQWVSSCLVVTHCWLKCPCFVSCMQFCLPLLITMPHPFYKTTKVIWFASGD